MTSERVDLEFGFSNNELANFLENFSEKLRDGDIGLSFKGREELRIEPEGENDIQIQFEEEKDLKQLDLKIHLEQETFDNQGSNGRQTINVTVEK